MTFQIGDRVTISDIPADVGTIVAIDGKLIYLDTDNGFHLVRGESALRMVLTSDEGYGLR